ncbi:MAG: aminotransferase class V-fold PLP-dependent enzyme, partial [Acidobacteria bacterium]|nr:aminotransferase class V-fold PLP-dependent enzyme [Acidobacteriota bacterium]
MIKVVEAKANQDYSLELKFNDGRRKRFQARPYLDAEAFRPLQSFEKFAEVKVENGTATWPNDLDISPDTLYIEGEDLDGAPSPTWDVEAIRRDFPVLAQTVNGKPLVYLDNAASSQVPQVVIDRGSKYLAEEHSNIHRGVHYLSQHATTAYEAAREKVKRFINAPDVAECIFVRGTTEGINLVAHSYGKKFVNKGDEILVSEMEHHSNIIPWQVMAEDRGAVIKVIPINDRGELIIDEYENLLNERTRMVAVAHVSNSLGTVNPIKEIVATAHKFGVPVCVDGAQSVPHFPVDVQDLDADFFAFSGHKMYAPT